MAISSDMKLGGSEQAVVNLSTEWANSGLKVAVYVGEDDQRH